jgi:hypothetical protein
MSSGKKRMRSCVNFALHKEDLERLRKTVAHSTCRSVSEYCRKVALGKPVRVFYRDQSFDAFTDEVIALRKEMQAIRENGPLTSEGEQRLITLLEEIKKYINKIFDHVCKDQKKPGDGCNTCI